MEIGRGPLALIRNRVLCACCGSKLPPASAGATIVAHHRGPELVGVAVTLNRRTVHACGKAKDSA